jgi:hypothetical protein
MGDYSHLKNKKGELIAKPLPQPTLPNLSVDDDPDDSNSTHTRVPPPSTYTQDYYYYNSDKSLSGDYLPPMPAYNPYSTHQPPGSYAHFNASQTTFTQEDSPYPQQMYNDDNDSSVHLTTAAAPYGQQYPIDRPGSARLPTGSNYDPHDVYQGRVGSSPDGSHRRSPPASSGLARPSSGLAYDQDYPSPMSAGPQPMNTSSGGSQSLQVRADNPYNGYSSYSSSPQGTLTAQQQQHHQGRRGRGYDEESGDGYTRGL